MMTGKRNAKPTPHGAYSREYGEPFEGCSGAWTAECLRRIADRVESAAENPLIGDEYTREMYRAEALQRAAELREEANVVERKAN